MNPWPLAAVFAAGVLVVFVAALVWVWREADRAEAVDGE